MKIAILFSYYNRPRLVRNALNSILESHKLHQDWELFFADDASPVPGEPIVREILYEHLDKITFYRNEDTVQDKVQLGTRLGGYGNESLDKTKADIAITLSDDDELIPTYTQKLSEYFETHPDVMYCYSRVRLYNPLFQNSKGIESLGGIYNKWDGPINPANKVDASQVAFRVDCYRKDGVRYPSRASLIQNLDSNIFQQLYDKYGDAQPSGLEAQYKGIHDYQLVWHKKKSESGLVEHYKELEELGGKLF